MRKSSNKTSTLIVVESFKQVRIVYYQDADYLAFDSFVNLQFHLLLRVSVDISLLILCV